ncbi:MAG: hypothetical protein AB8B74_14115 [Crocinitomicaceae bacterium]
MSKSIRLLLLLIALSASSSVSAQKKNSFSYQIGILNHFYDENPVLFHADHIQYVTKIKHVATKLLIRSRGFSYTRALNNKSNISIIGAKFNGDYTITSTPLRANVIKRNWSFGTIEYNRKAIDKNRFQLFYGGGLTYRKGFEGYFIDIDAASGVGLVHSGFAESVTTASLGTTLNTNLKYTFWKNFFLYSKLDLQYYFYKSQLAKQEFADLQNKFGKSEFVPLKRVNNTFTIGIGMDF